MQLHNKFQIFNRSIWIAVILLLIQQTIVASSTIWLTRLIAHLQEGHFVFSFLGLYLISLFLPYFPGAVALIEMAKAKVLAKVDYANRFSEIYKGRIFEWSNRTNQNTKSSILTGEAPQTIDDFLEFFYQLISTSFNVILNLVALAIIVEPLLLLSYAIGILLSFLVLKFQEKYKKILALKTQQSRIKWFGMLLKVWDNVLLNNKYNFIIWNSRSQKRANRLVNNAIKLQGFSQFVSVAMAFVLLIPSFALVIYLAIQRSNDLNWLAILIVTLPRLFQVLSYSYEMLFVLSELPVEKNRLKTIKKILNVPPPSSIELEKRIQWDKIFASYNSKLLPVKELIDSLPDVGRITLRGDNGTGKTSLLLLLKHKRGGDAFYLPAKHDLVFQKANLNLSTGQQTSKILHELLDKFQNTIILLDEWDANLDNENAKHISSLIDQLAKHLCVIESRHLRK